MRDHLADKKRWKSETDFETYTCVCGGQRFTIQDNTITCPACGKIYLLILKKHRVESPGEFNSRIRSEEGIKE
ncbi:hypothetical protein ES703_107056 [subsurface metagenome]